MVAFVATEYRIKQQYKKTDEETYCAPQKQYFAENCWEIHMFNPVLELTLADYDLRNPVCLVIQKALASSVEKSLIII